MAKNPLENGLHFLFRLFQYCRTRKSRDVMTSVATNDNTLYKPYS